MEIIYQCKLCGVKTKVSARTKNELEKAYSQAIVAHRRNCQPTPYAPRPETGAAKTDKVSTSPVSGG